MAKDLFNGRDRLNLTAPKLVPVGFIFGSNSVQGLDGDTGDLPQRFDNLFLIIGPLLGTRA